MAAEVVVENQGPPRRTGAELKLDGLFKSYRDVHAVNAVSLSVTSGEFVTMLGPSGSGKTTTLMMVAGFVEPDAGDVFLGGVRVTDTPTHRRGIGMVFQHYALFPHMTVFENIAYPLRMRKISRGNIKARVGTVLEMVQLPDVAARYPRQLSGGQQQRIAVARALVYEPRLLLMDEPLGALDRKLREQMQLELRTLQQSLGITTLYVTHDQEEAMSMSDRIVVMRDGKIEQVGTPGELYENPQTLFVASFIGESNILHGHTRPGGETALFECAEGLVIPVKLQTPGDFQRCHLIVRPERVMLSPGPAFEVSLPGKVSSVTYLGERIRFAISLSDQVTISALHQNAGNVSRPRIGDSVQVGWNARDASIITDECKV
jgi:putative spermidine/putrescine transport system ATP-binding protein